MTARTFFFFFPKGMATKQSQFLFEINSITKFIKIKFVKLIVLSTQELCILVRSFFAAFKTY